MAKSLLYWLSSTLSQNPKTLVISADLFSAIHWFSLVNETGLGKSLLKSKNTSYCFWEKPKKVNKNKIKQILIALIFDN
ncbi:hypothetical protein [Flavobacterium sp.]|uniref:hypothetical protein n=1 Tax=Flavobacterium sp. TaxID=239 RepID=UPI0037BE74BD